MTDPFTPASHPLAVGVLRSPTKAEARDLGAACAGFDPWLRYGTKGAALATYLESPDPALHRFAILWEGRAAGILAVRFPWLRGPFIEMLAVLPERRGRGLAGAAAAWAEARAATVAGNLWASVSDFNAPARAFWTKRGFADVIALQGLIGDGDEILLRKRLAPKP
jgi:GNAT superfamily N-acetyltransferase